MSATTRHGGPSEPLELWAGFECTLNRVGDEQIDQLAIAGHYDRLDDIDRLAGLGIRTVRYPILWERIVAGVPNGAPWEWTSTRLERMRELGIEPIVGLVHHGSGPLHTSLLHDDFADGLADFAREVAQRYPWLRYFTPVNEPLTTARFSALYGHWYPHARSDAAFWRALLNQVRAIRLSMEAIRRVIPDARLVQTEDLGRTHATPRLQYQADAENERRWLTFDLLAGRMTRTHPMWSFARSVGISWQEITRATGGGCMPDIIGINHYVTSERWLDERLELYPARTHGGNGRQRYADVEAVRALRRGIAGPKSLLGETWERYGAPIAVTEAHLGCTREHQLRWLAEMWDAATAARADGADVRAVTAWAALGSWEWSSLVTRRAGDYEPGLFDMRGGVPRPTALAQMVKSLATTGQYDHPAAAGPGWWRTPGRVLYPAQPPAASSARAPSRRPAAARQTSRARRPRPVVLVAGASGTLGSAFTRICAERGVTCRGASRRELDLCDPKQVAAALRDANVWAVVNASGYVRVDDAEHEPVRCREINVGGAVALARECASSGIRLATFSSDLVFDGSKSSPYLESDVIAPLGVYGESKAESERRVLEAMPDALVVRTAAFFGPWDEWNFATRTLASIASGVPVSAADDCVVSPTYVPDLVNATLDLLMDGERGIWHLANAGAVSWADFARLVADAAGLDASLVHGCPQRRLGEVAARPRQAALASERGALMPPLADAVARYTSAQALSGDSRTQPHCTSH